MATEANAITRGSPGSGQDDCSICDGAGSHSDVKRDRANNNLDRHIEAGGAHGDAAQKIKNRLNGGGGCSICN